MVSRSFIVDFGDYSRPSCSLHRDWTPPQGVFPHRAIGGTRKIQPAPWCPSQPNPQPPSPPPQSPELPSSASAPHSQVIASCARSHSSDLHPLALPVLLAPDPLPLPPPVLSVLLTSTLQSSPPMSAPLFPKARPSQPLHLYLSGNLLLLVQDILQDDLLLVKVPVRAKRVR